MPDALHSIRSLLCTATNETPHERLFSYNRKSATGCSIPSWLTPGRVYVRNHTRNSKHDPVVVEAELLQANPQYAFIKLDSGFETTVSLRDVAPCKRIEQSSTSGNESSTPNIAPSINNDNEETTSNNIPPCHNEPVIPAHETDVSLPTSPSTRFPAPVENSTPPVELRRSTRSRRGTELFADSSYSSLNIITAT